MKLTPVLFVRPVSAFKVGTYVRLEGKVYFVAEKTNGLIKLRGAGAGVRWVKPTALVQLCVAA
jgi:hypothetical protein